MTLTTKNSLILGVCLIAALALFGVILGMGAKSVKQLERTVTAKGLSEREVPADIVIWPIKFTVAGNDIEALYRSIETNTATIKQFLTTKGVAPSDVSVSAPEITDRYAQAYQSGAGAEFRYAASQSVTVYSKDIKTVRAVMSELSEIGKQGIVLSGDYDSKPEYLYTGLSDIKPAMIEESTQNAREVAGKFAADSDSRLGKIKTASQGQFTIDDRDQNNPHIKKVRVVSTVQYYLAD